MKAINEIKKSSLAVVITTAIIGIILGILMIAIARADVILTMINIVLIITGVVSIIANIPGLIRGIVNISSTEGLLDLIWSALGIVVGILLLINRGTVISIIVAAYLIIMPVIRIIAAKSGTRARQLKSELPLLIIGLIIAFLIPGTFEDGAVTVLIWLMRVAGIFLILSSLIYGICMYINITKNIKNHVDEKATVIYADTNGDGNIDTVYKDTTGDGKIDTEIRIR